MADYAPPLHRLLELGQPEFGRKWFEYQELGIGPGQIPDLIQMATDMDLHQGDADSLAVYAPVHAWRALGQLGAAESLPALLGLFDRFDEDDDWALTDFPHVFAGFGPAVIPALAAYVNDPAHDTYARWVACDGLMEIGARFPEVRNQCVDGLAQPLAQTAEIDREVNAAAVIGLLHLKAVEAAPLIEIAFEADRVEEMIVGDWPRVRYELGLGPKPPQRRPLWSSAPRGDLSPKERAQDRKAKRKRERQARKRNRKRH